MKKLQPLFPLESELRVLHDKVCQTCDGCTYARCAFTEGYNRGKKEAYLEMFKLVTKDVFKTQEDL